MVATSRAVPVAADGGAGDYSSSAVSWAAIIAGGVTAAAVSLILLILGTGLGLTAVSPWSTAEGAAALGVGALAWLVVMQWVSAGFGGYLAGRLRTRWLSLRSDEVFFRDTAHGFLSWAVATLLSAALLASAASAVVSGTATTAATVLTGTAQGAAEGAAQSADATAGSETAYFVDMLFRSDRPAGTTSQQARGESERIFVRSLGEGGISPADKTYLAQVVATQTGMTEQEAATRIDEVIAEANAAAERVKQAADEARKAAATIAIVSFLSLLVGAFIASVAAVLGGRERDEVEDRYSFRERRPA